MSVIAAKVYKDKIVMAADSIIVYGWSKKTNDDFVKIQNINEMIIGGCGTAQENSLMWQYMKTHKPASPTEKDVLEYIVEFARWKKDLTGDYTVCNEYLLAYDGHLFKIEGLCVSEIHSYDAIGAGMDFSNAALYLGHSPREAVKVACELCCMVAEPIIEHTMTR